MKEDNIAEVFSHNLAVLMDGEHMKQTELAERLGVSRAQVSTWVAGKNVPRTNHLSKMCAVFNCNLSDLLTDRREQPSIHAASREEERLVGLFRALNGAGKSKVVEYAEDLSGLDRYTK